MTRDWKPGDVAMVMCSDDKERIALYDILYNTGVWVFRDGTRRNEDQSTARPLLVIDLEDREQVKRLAEAIPDCGEPANHCDPQQCMSLSCWIDRVQTALRSLLTPPKPEEPTGVGAVVVDADSYVWVRLNETHWHSEFSPNNRRTWAEISAVRVLTTGYEIAEPLADWERDLLRGVSDAD